MSNIWYRCKFCGCVSLGAIHYPACKAIGMLEAREAKQAAEARPAKARGRRQRKEQP